MPWPGFASVEHDGDGIEVPLCPGHSEMYWREDPAAADPATVVGVREPVYRSEQGGEATVRHRLLSEDPYSAGAEAELSWPTVWSVVLIDSLESTLCPSAPPTAPVVGEAIAFLGAGNALFYHGNSLFDDQERIVARLLSNAVAPAGAGGEALFTNVYLALSFATSGIVYVTPILDGELLTAERTAVAFDNGGSGRKVADFEVGLGRTVGTSRHGLRGTWFQALLEVVDLGGCGPLVIEGTEVEHEIVTEGVEDRPAPTRDLTLRAKQDSALWFFGAGAALLEGDVGSTDNGADVEARAETNALAPAGVGGECVFTNVYLTVIHELGAPLEVRLVPILDGEEQAPLELTLEAGEPRRKQHEFGLSVPYPSAENPKHLYAMRGTWFAVRVETVGALPAGRVTFEGLEVEHEVVTEGTEASNAG